MTERRGNWAWERPHADLENMERAELRMLRWIIDAEVTIGRFLVVTRLGQEKAMAALDAITEAVAADRAVTQAEHDEVQAALAALTTSIADLQAKVDALTAGSVTQEEIDAVVADVTALGTDVANIYTAPEPPVVEARKR